MRSWRSVQLEAADKWLLVSKAFSGKIHSAWTKTTSRLEIFGGWRINYATDTSCNQFRAQKATAAETKASLLGGTMASVAVANAKSFPTPDARMPVGRGRLGVAPSMAK